MLVPVLDKGWIKLQAVMGNDYTIINDARRCYGSENKGPEADKKFLFSLLRRGHNSPFEQVEFKFLIHLPVLVMWQWVRHRTWNYLSSSGRYQEFSPEMFYLPEWRKQNDQLLEGTAPYELTSDLIDHLAQSYVYYQKALDEGVAKEQARLFLPAFGLYYTLTAKVDAHNLMGFLHQRLARDAQWEIRQYAEAIYENFFKVELPWTAEAFEIYRK